jgi:hypothetical protein
VTLTPDEEAAALAQKAAWDADNTQDKRAMRAIDGLDRIQFRLLFNHENRIRVLEGKAQVTAAQFRQALIDDWKANNP